MRTTLPGVNYFILGNGLILAAIQHCPIGAGTPLGLIVMDPKRSSAKRDALTSHPERGLALTQCQVRIGAEEYLPLTDGLTVEWASDGEIPTVLAKWHAGSYGVEERFFCPDRAVPRLIRQITLHATNATQAGEVRLMLGDQTVVCPFSMEADQTVSFSYQYELSRSGSESLLHLRPTEVSEALPDARDFWSGLTRCIFPVENLHHLFSTARRHLPAVVENADGADAALWQGGRERVRDQCAIARGLTMLGAHDLARAAFLHLVQHHVTPTGELLDGGRYCLPESVDLDLHGELLHALETYANWTQDWSLIEKNWPHILAAANYPLLAMLRHDESGLLHNRREYWGRSVIHGVQDGIEFAHQFWVSIGLHCAVRMARRVSRTENIGLWEREADRLKRALLHDPRYGLVADNCLIKRRGLDGKIQHELVIPPDTLLPPGVSLMQSGAHPLNPDTSTAMAVAHEFIDPKSDLARHTLKAIEKLWNQGWQGGGYGRHHAASDLDVPGPWPHVSLLVARAHLEAGNYDKVWRVVNWLASQPQGRSGAWFEFLGPRVSPPYPQVGVSPRVWSEIVCLVVHHLFGVRPADDYLLIRPRLLNKLDRAEANLKIGGNRVNLVVRRASATEKPAARVNDAPHNFPKSGLRLPLPQADLRVEITVPAR